MNLMNAPLFHRTLAGVAVAAVLVLAGCASKTPLNTPAPVENRDALGGAGSGGAGAAAGQTPQSTVANVNLSNKDAALAGAGRIVYFDFDSFVVKDDYRAVVESMSKALTSNKQRRMTVEGHTDERGGREYNLALGQKRAEAVVQAMTLLGAQTGQLEAVSFGKEKPAVQGSDEAAWAKNRRAEIKDR
jgi:peptidoglycan-associated lipoprotein